MNRWLRLGCAVAVFSAMTVFGGCNPPSSEAESPNAPAKKEGKDATMNKGVSKSGYDIAPLPKEKVAELASKLSPEAIEITQKAGTERAFCGGLLDNKKDGVYACAVCDLPLFSSEHKFNSGTGWPSFHSEVDPQHVTRHSDNAHGRVLAFEDAL